MKGGKRVLPEALKKNQEFLKKVKNMLGVKMSLGLNPFLTPFRTKAKNNVGDSDKDKMYAETLKLVKEYVDKHGKQKAINEIKNHDENIRKNKKPRGSKKKKRSKTKK